MRKNIKVLGALAVAGVVATTGSAFTAGSTLDKQAITVGSVKQTVSGAKFTNVAHTYTADTDTTTKLTARATQLLSTTSGVVKVHLNDSASADANGCTVTHVDTSSPADTVDSSDVICDIVDTANVTSIRFVVNG